MTARVGRVIAILGAESTGKTELARSLAERLAAAGHDAVWVPEHLRAWCDAHGRTPRRDEQRGVADAQTAAIAQAAATHAFVVADTTALMTAVYSRIVFGDTSLDAEAVAAHTAGPARADCTLVTALDLPWQPDGLQRDGEQVRAPVDAVLTALLADHRIGWTRIGGTGRARTDAALAALAALVAPPVATVATAQAAGGAASARG